MKIWNFSLIILLASLLMSCTEQAVYSLRIKNDTNYKMRLHLVDDSGFPNKIDVYANKDTVINSIKMEPDDFNGATSLVRDLYSSIMVESSSYQTARFTHNEEPVNCTIDLFKDEEVWEYSTGTVYVYDQKGIIQAESEIYTATLSHDVLY